MNKRPNDTKHHKQFEDYGQWLLKLGEGRLPSAKTKEQICPDTDVIEIPHDMVRDSKDEVIEEIFEDFEAK